MKRNDQSVITEEERIQKVWKKAQAVHGYDPKVFRRDICGWWIKFDEYGNNESHYGWEIDHIVSLAEGGSEDFSNLQPLNWRNKAFKAERSSWNCKDMET